MATGHFLLCKCPLVTEQSGYQIHARPLQRGARREEKQPYKQLYLIKTTMVIAYISILEAFDQ